MARNGLKQDSIGTERYQPKQYSRRNNILTKFDNITIDQIFSSGKSKEKENSEVTQGGVILSMLATIIY